MQKAKANLLFQSFLGPRAIHWKFQLEKVKCMDEHAEQDVS